MSIRIWILLVLVFSAWFFVTLKLAPPLSGTDVSIFRDAGSNLALTGRFEAPGLPFTNSIDEKLFAHYTPLTPLLFGLFAKALGLSSYTASLFYLCLGALLAAITVFLLASSIEPKKMKYSANFVVLAALPSLFFDIDRPEAVAIILFAVAIYLAHRRNVVSKWWAYVAAAAVLLDHPFAGIVSILWVSVLRFRFIRADKAPLQNVVKEFLCGMLLIACLVGGTAVYFHAKDPTSIDRFLSHATGGRSGSHAARAIRQSPSAGTFCRRYLSSLKWGITCSRSSSESIYCSLGIGILIVAVRAFVRRIDHGSERGILLLSLLTLVLPVLAFPGKVNYPQLVVSCVIVGLLCAGSMQKLPGLAMTGCLLLIVAGTIRLPFVARDFFIRAENLRSFSLARDQARRLAEHLPAGSPVLIQGDTYDAFKSYVPYLVNASYVSQADLSKIAAVISCYDGRPIKAQASWPAFLDRSSYTQIEAAPDHVTPRLLGHPLHSQWGWTCDLYERHR